MTDHKVPPSWRNYYWNMDDPLMNATVPRGIRRIRFWRRAANAFALALACGGFGFILTMIWGGAL